MLIADLAQELQQLPSQLAADLVLGVPMILVVVLVLLSVSSRRRRRTW